MLAPETRALLTDALRPPEGHRIDIAVATTYSLDLLGLLIAPLSFALIDAERAQDVDQLDPIRLVEAVRRHADRTTVFCQAGGIQVPAVYRSVLAFAEDSVRQVQPTSEGRIFHPKVWALRFVSAAGIQMHRVLVMSRNLTFDRSWDTLLRLDETPDLATYPDTAPLVAFLRALPGLDVTGLPTDRVRQIRSLASSIAGARLAPPPPFDRVAFAPLGVNGSPWPFSAADRLVAITPFVDKSSVARLGALTEQRQLISRAETLDRLGSDALTGWECCTLQRPAEVPEGDNLTPADPAHGEWLRPPEGLHAKTFLCERGNRASVVTGSANLTRAGFGGNVEFDVVLEGPRNSCGIDAMLDGNKEAPGLSRMLEPYTPKTTDGIPDAAQESAWLLELFHQRLGAAHPVLTVQPGDDERVEATLSFDDFGDIAGPTTVWPISLPAASSALPLDGRALRWAPIARSSVTPFIAVESTTGQGDARAKRRCVIRADLAGEVGRRRDDVLREVLRNKDDVLRYLIFLLGDPAYELLWSSALSEYHATDEAHGVAGIDTALLEPLVRAAGRDDDDALARVASLVADLRRLAGEDELLPDGFAQLWQIVWEAYRMETRR